MSDIGYGQQRPGDVNSEIGVIMFACRQLIAEMSTMKLVRVVAVTGGGEGEPAGTVDVQPLVSQVDGNGYGTEHGIVPGIPWARVQGGSGGIICDPVVDDIGYVVVSDRDISKVKATRAPALPGSSRMYDLADGVYVGGVLADAPTQYLAFLPDGGFKIIDSFGNVISSGEAGIDLTPCAGGKVTISGIAFEDHLHHVASAAPTDTGPPLP